MEEKRTIGYLCPKCGAAVIAERSVFALSAGTAAVICDCGKSKLVLDYEGDAFHVTVPCGICGGEHTARVDAKAVLTGRGVALTCPETRQYCCLMGEDGRVSAGMRELAITADKIKAQQENPQAFVDNVIMYEILSELKDIAGRGGISCACGCKEYTVEVRPGAVDLICASCGAKLRLDAATDDDLDRLCCRDRLEIPGKSRQ